jgi:hypothetical protein
MPGRQNGQTARRVEMRNRSGGFQALALQQRAQRSRSSREAASIIRAGISSHPISSRKSGIRRFIHVLRKYGKVNVSLVTRKMCQSARAKNIYLRGTEVHRG